MADFAHLDHDVDPWPSWGSLALDAFMIDNWNSSSNMSGGDQRLALVRDYVQAGSLGRKPYVKKAAQGAVKPTDEQVETILRPLRLPALRYVAETLISSSTSSGNIWLRTAYEDEERHQTFCENLLDTDCVDSGEGLYEDSKILSDSRYYSFNSWRKVLDILPEMVSNFQETEMTNDSYRGGERRRKQEREYMDCQADAETAERLLARQQECCWARHLIVEDQEMFATDPPRFHAFWLDDLGNIVRENRITAGEACDYPPMVGEGMGAEQPIWLEAKVGSKYVSGAEYGPPFSTPTEDAG